MLKGTVYIYIGEGLLFISLYNENCDINILMEEFPKHGLTDLQKKKFPFNIRCYIDKTNGPKRVNCHLEIEQQCQRYL